MRSKARRSGWLDNDEDAIAKKEKVKEEARDCKRWEEHN